MGIPIGPDSSRIISELVLSAADKMFQDYMVGTTFAGIRNVDDYYLYFRTMADLEKGRSKLQKVLREFELELNHVKERIVELPEIMESEWKTAVRAFRIRKTTKFERADLIAFFDLCFTMARKYPDEIVITYAIAKLRSRKIKKANWELLQAYFLHCLNIESKVIEQVVKELLRYKQEYKYKLNRKIVKQAFEAFLLYHQQHDHHFEILWTLWYFKQEKISLSNDVAKLLNETTNDLVILMLLDLEDSMLVSGLSKYAWQTFISKEHLTSEHWLLAYEVSMNGFLPAAVGILEDNPFFSFLKNKGVRFFKSDRQLDEDSFIVASGSSLAKELTDNEDLEAFEDNNEEEFDFDKNHIENAASEEDNDISPFDFIIN